MPACSLGLVGLGIRVRDKVRVSVMDRVCVIGLAIALGFCHTSSPQKTARIAIIIIIIDMFKVALTVETIARSTASPQARILPQIDAVESGP